MSVVGGTVLEVYVLRRQVKTQLKKTPASPPLFRILLTFGFLTG